MKISCEKTLLQNAVSTASRAAAVKSSVPSLEGVLIDAYSDTVYITGYDLKTGIKTSLPADVAEPGGIVLNSRLFGEIIRRLPDDIIELSVSDNGMVKISGGASKFNIMGISAEDYPDLPTIDNSNSVYVAEKTLREMIARTIFAVSDNEARPVHTGSLFEIENNILTVVSVDGYRLAMMKKEIASADFDNGSFVVPGSALSEVEKIASDDDEQVKISVGTKQIMFTIKNTVLISRRLEGDFLNYRKAVPETGKYNIEADRKELIDSVDRVSLIISDKVKSPVKFSFGENTLHVCTTTPLGQADDDCSTEGDGEGLEIGFNNKYIIDALKAAPADRLRLRLTSGVAPCVIVPADGGDEFLYMILPVRLRANEN